MNVYAVRHSSCVLSQVPVCLTQPCTAPETESTRVSPPSVTALNTISSSHSLYQLCFTEDTIEDLDMSSINGVRRLNVFEDKHLK